MKLAVSLVLVVAGSVLTVACSGGSSGPGDSQQTGASRGTSGGSGSSGASSSGSSGASSSGAGATSSGGSSSSSSGATSSSGSSGGSSSGSVDPVPGAIEVKPGSFVTLNSTPGGTGNAQRNYYVRVPAGASALEIHLSAGSCKGSCIGDDVHVFLKGNDEPDALSPDSKTSKLTYTPSPNGTALMGHRSPTEGLWYVAVIDDANTLGYSHVLMTAAILK